MLLTPYTLTASLHYQEHLKIDTRQQSRQCDRVMKQPALTPLCLYSGRWRSACLCLLERRGSSRSYETWRLWGGFLLHLQKMWFFLIFGQKRGLKWKEVLKYFKNLWDKLLLWQKQAYSLVSKSNNLHPPQRVKKLKWFSLHYSSWTKLIKCVVMV